MNCRNCPFGCVWQGNLIRIFPECPLEFLFHTVVLQSPPGGCPVSSSRIVGSILRLQNQAAAQGDVKRKAAEVQQQRCGADLGGPFFSERKWGSTGMIQQTGCFFFGFGNKWLKKNEKRSIAG